MRLITGGVAQGQLQYAQEKYGIDSSGCVDAAFASKEDMEQAALVYNLQEYIRGHHRGSECPLPVFQKDAILLCDEVGSGIVPLSREERAFREAAGRICCMLAEQAESVELVRCGIARRIK